MLNSCGSGFLGASSLHKISGRTSHSGREEGADTFLDNSAAEALLHVELLDPVSRDGMVGTKALVKGLKSGLAQRGVQHVGGRRVLDVHYGEGRARQSFP